MGVRLIQPFNKGLVKVFDRKDGEAVFHVLGPEYSPKPSADGKSFTPAKPFEVHDEKFVLENNEGRLEKC